MKIFLAIFQIKDEFTQEDTWKLYFDGASNVLGHDIGAILISPEREYCPFTAKLNFGCTNIVAEYEACIMGLQAAIAKKVKNLKVYQLREDWLTQDSKMVL